MIRRLVHYFLDQQGAVSPMMVLLLIPLCGIMALAGETSFWFMTQRALQNAADSAALAAATNNDLTLDANGRPRYENEAFAVASAYGFASGENGITVTPLDSQTCPAPSTDTDCYKVTVRRDVPLYLTRVVGYLGDVDLADGRKGKIVTGVALAKPRSQTAQYCMIGLDTSGNPVTINGGPSVDLSGCDMKSNADLVCNGANSDTGVSYGDAVGSSNCGAIERPGQPPTPDPFAYLNANPPIPSRTCSSYPQTATVGNGNLIGGPSTSFAQPFCGNVKLSGDIPVSAANTVLTIQNGSLDLNGHTLKTTGSGSMTVIFTGPSTPPPAGTTYEHYPISSVNNAGVLDITAPSSGALQGVAIMQDKRLTNSRNHLDMTYTGNGPTLKITGLVYFPNGTFDIRGAINHNTGGLSCIGVIAKKIKVSGNGAIFHNPTDDCGDLGLALPGISGTDARQSLVQ